MQIAKFIPFLLIVATAAACPLPIDKPHPSNATSTAHWLISLNSWGVFSTISNQLGGSPFGNVVSFNDGVPNDGRGLPYFYLTKLDPTARDALRDERSLFTVSEFLIGTYGKIDPENPLYPSNF